MLEWVLDRCNSKLGSIKTPIGYLPKPADIDMTGLDLTSGALEWLLSIDKREWLKELKSIKEFFKQFKKDLPDELWQEYAALEERLKLSA